MLVCGPGSELSVGKGVALQAASTSARVLPAGRVAVLRAGGGTGMTSEQSVSKDLTFPVVASLDMAALNLLFMRFGSAEMSC